jgi:hypothetical protein
VKLTVKRVRGKTIIRVEIGDLVVTLEYPITA